MIRAADVVLIALAIVVEGILILQFWGGRDAGHSATIHTPSGSIQVALDHDQTFPVEGAIGTSIIEIHDGKIRFVKSPCTRKICVRSGFHQHTGSSSACVPNRISFSVDGLRDDGFDAMNH